MNARICEQSFGRTNMHADRRTDALTHACMQTHERMHWWTLACMIKHLDARTCTRTDRSQTDGRTDGLTYTQSRTRACTNTNGRMLTRTHDALRYIRTDGEPYAHMFVRRQTPKYNMEVRSKKLKVRNKKCRACIDERTHVRTNIWTHEHARGQTDGRTDSNIRPHARVHANTRMQ